MRLGVIAGIVFLLSLATVLEANTAATSDSAQSSSKTSKKSQPKKKVEAAPRATATAVIQSAAPVTNSPVPQANEPPPVPSVWVNSLIGSDASDVVEALAHHRVAYNVHQSPSALGASKLVIAFGPAAPVKDIKAVALALPYAYITYVAGESFVEKIVFVGLEVYDEKKIVPISKVYEAIAVAPDLETIVRTVPRSEDPHG